MPVHPKLVPKEGRFIRRGQHLAYSEYGDGKRWVVLLPGLLLPVEMQQHLARHLAGHGCHVVTFDPLGHGKSDRPRDMWRYSVAAFADEVIALLDHLDVDQAVIGGTSLGANITLEAASMAPLRVRGMIIEMPVLEHGLIGSAIAFAPLLVALFFGERFIGAFAKQLRRIPRRIVPFWGNIALDTIRQEPGPSAAVLQGLFFGHTAPHRDVRRTLTQPALIIGHHRDPIHPFSDAGLLGEELPNARLVEASSILELRLKPERLSAEIAKFVDECWAPKTVNQQPRTRRRSA